MGFTKPIPRVQEIIFALPRHFESLFFHAQLLRSLLLLLLNISGDVGAYIQLRVVLRLWPRSGFLVENWRAPFFY